ncbi:putative DSBA-like thioredoxin domain, Thioredoxin-like superfamily [Septoria linicola]|nr:putative DSBA-like thioredoxin domain, Thioredoxin-like superfamily [Septoria linicola]
MSAFQITVYTDTICPWCYIGHKSMDRAIDLYKRTYPGGSQDEFVFTYLPYYLDPNAPEKGIPWPERVAQKNGADKVNAIRTRLQRVGRANGIEFNFDSKIGKTRDSQRLLQHVLQTRGNAAHKILLEEIYQEHFEQDCDITSHADLTRAAVRAGLPEEEVTAFLASDALSSEVDALAAESRQKGVNSVPTYEVNGKRINVEGAGDPSEFLEALIACRQ